MRGEKSTVESRGWRVRRRRDSLILKKEQEKNMNE